MKRSLTPDQLTEFQKCRADVVYMVKTFGWMRHTSRGAIRWDKPYSYQVKMLRALQRGDNVIANKSRQIGCSVTAVAFAVWLMIFHPDIVILVLSQKEKYAIDFLKKAKFFFNRLPFYLRPKVTTDSQTLFAVTFKTKVGEQQYISESAIHSLTTTTDTGRGFSARLVIMDEAAALPNAEATWAAVLPTTTHGGQIAVISTPAGVSNFYHRLWTKVSMGEDIGFTPIIAYYKDCGFDEEWLKKVTAGMTIQQILQEYELQFISSGSPFFDLNHLALCYKPSHEYPELKDARGIDLRQPTYNNFTGIDTAQGKRTEHGDPDYHSIVTLNEFGVEVGAFHSNKMGLEEFAGYTMTLPNGDKVEIEGKTSKWHREYPGSCVIESNGPGGTVLNRHTVPDDGRSMVIGRMTTGSQYAGKGSKMRMLNLLKLGLAGKQVIVTDPFTYVCLQAYENQGENKAGAAAGMFDDPVIALALAYHQLYKHGGMQMDLPEEMFGGRRVIALKREEDLKPGELMDMLPVGEILSGPIWEESPGTGRMADELENVRSSRVLEPLEHGQ